MSYEKWRESLKTQEMPRDSGVSTSVKTLAKVQAMAESFNKMLDKYIVRKSKWSGAVVESNMGYSAKDWNCDILAHLNDCPDMAILHELIHARSVSYYSYDVWKSNKAIEEATVQLLTQEIATLEKIPFAKSGYDDWVEILRAFNRETKSYKDDLQFARRLLRVPLDYRTDWLLAKARRYIELKGGNIGDLLKITESLSKIM